MMQAGEVFEHAMLREIYEQPRALADTIEHYAPNGKLATDVFQPVADALRGRARLVIAASGSSRHAGLAAEIMLEDLAGLIVDGHCRNDEALRGDAHQLQKGLQAVQHPQWIGGFKVDLVGSNRQMIGLVFIHLLHGCARPRGLYEEPRLVQHSLTPKGNSGFP